MINPGAKRGNWARNLISLGVIGILVLGFLAFNEYVNKTDVDKREYERREAAKEFNLPVIAKSQYFKSHDNLSLSEAGKKPVLLHFWASWCQICRVEKPDLDAFWAKHKDEDILVLGVASFDTKAAMDDSKLLATPTFTVVLDEDGELANKYKVAALPVSVLIDEDGFIVRTFKGVLQPYDFAAIEAYLASRKEAH